ncbi:SNAP25 ous protein [Ancistrocladus abbreviatus]
MFGFMKSPFKSATDAEANNTSTTNPPRRTSSEPIPISPDGDDDDWGKRPASSATSPYRPPTAEQKKRYKDDFSDSGGLENQSVQELESYAAYKAEETTSTVNNCLRIAEDIREDAAKTLDTLHQQGEQINRTHQMAVNIDQDLSKGEKLLNSLGGMFSKPWKPKKTKNIAGPVYTPDDSSKSATKEQREKLGVAPKGKTASKTSTPEPTSAMQKVELEKAKQDDALSEISNILGDLKGMAVDMGTELDGQNKALDHLGDDIDELNSRMKGANKRAQKLVK